MDQPRTPSSKDIALQNLAIFGFLSKSPEFKKTMELFNAIFELRESKSSDIAQLQLLTDELKDSLPLSKAKIEGAKDPLAKKILLETVDKLQHLLPALSEVPKITAFSESSIQQEKSILEIFSKFKEYSNFIKTTPTLETPPTTPKRSSDDKATAPLTPRQQATSTPLPEEKKKELKQFFTGLLRPTTPKTPSDKATASATPKQKTTSIASSAKAPETSPEPLESRALDQNSRNLDSGDFYI